MTAAFPEDVAVAIVCHNNRATLAATLESVQDAGCPPERVTVVDAANAGAAIKRATTTVRTPLPNFCMMTTPLLLIVDSKYTVTKFLRASPVTTFL